jgi:carbamate kinase
LLLADNDNHIFLLYNSVYDFNKPRRDVPMSKRVVIALGGNAILHDDPSAQAQQHAVREICASIARLVEDGYEVIIAHGNGPQVGNLYLHQRNSRSAQNPALPLDSCVAMTQGSIGYWLQNALGEILRAIGSERQVVSLITQVQVDANDPAFDNPTKPIGPFLSEQEALFEKETHGGHYMEDAGRGWRKVVASPMPISIVEKTPIAHLLERGTIVVCCGGGGIPVVQNGYGYKGIEAVIDKDLAAELLAVELMADTFLILTGVDNVCVDYGKSTQRALFEIDTVSLRRLMDEGQFPAGSMLPKVQAAIRFAESEKGRRTIITSIPKASQIDQGQCTQVTAP